MISKSQAQDTLRRLFGGGPLDRMPKKTQDEDLLLALAAAGLNSQAAYPEQELSAHLESWLHSFTVPGAVDHVTLRRALVDYRFLKRDTAGAHYTVNEDRVDTVIEPEARTLHPAAVFKDVQREREARKRKHTVGS